MSLWVLGEETRRLAPDVLIFGERHLPMTIRIVLLKKLYLISMSCLSNQEAYLMQPILTACEVQKADFSCDHQTVSRRRSIKYDVAAARERRGGGGL